MVLVQYSLTNEIDLLIKVKCSRIEVLNYELFGVIGVPLCPKNKDCRQYE